MPASWRSESRKEAEVKVPIYRIVGWEEYYEYSRTKEHKKLKWVRIGNNFDGDRITELISQGGAEAYGCFVAMVLVASRCDPRGTLMNSQGKPHTPETIGAKTGLPAGAFACTLGLCLNMNLIEIEGHTEASQVPGSVEGQSRVSRGSLPTPHRPCTDPIEIEGHSEASKVPGSVEGQSRVTTDPEQGPTDRQRLQKERQTDRQEQKGSDEGQSRVTAGSNSAAAAVSQNEGEEIKLSQVVSELTSIGMDARVIPQLTADHPYPKILEAIAMVLARGDDVRNKAGLVRTALEGGYTTEKPKSDYAKKQAKIEETQARQKEQQKQDEAKIRAELQKSLETLAALPPAEFEALAEAAYKTLPDVVRLRVPEDSDPLENTFWKSACWAEYQKRHTSPQSDDLIPGGV